MGKTPTTPKPDEVDPDFVRPFADWLLEQSHGRTHTELGEGLRDLVAKCLETGKAGTLSLTIKVKPMDANDDQSPLVVSDEIKLRLPEHDRKASIFYKDKTGNLGKSDPNQLTFESLRKIDGVGDVDTSTGEVKNA